MLELKTTNIADFQRALLPTEPHFARMYRTWSFRGQADARWRLVPSIWRKRSWDLLGGPERFDLTHDGNLITSPPDAVERAETRMLNVLGRVVDRVGLTPHLKEDDRLMAFAQHIGLPTRLLDWTRSSSMAAYFAAADAARQSAPDGDLVVYAMSGLYMQHAHDMKDVEAVSVPGEANPNLIAQQGRLIKVTGARCDLLDGVTRDPIALGFRPSEMQARAVHNHFVAVTLPWAKAGELLRSLRDQGIHAATAFPGQRGVAELVREVLLVAD